MFKRVMTLLILLVGVSSLIAPACPEPTGFSCLTQTNITSAHDQGEIASPADLFVFQKDRVAGADCSDHAVPDHLCHQCHFGHCGLTALEPDLSLNGKGSPHYADPLRYIPQLFVSRLFRPVIA